MARIKVIDEDDADGRLAELYRQMVDPDSGRVDTILRIHSLNPEGLESHFRLYRSAMRGTPGLRKADRELIAVVVSAINECHY